MANIFLTQNETFGPLGGEQSIFGSTGDETVLVEAGANFTIDATTERVELPGDVADFNFQTVGTGVEVTNASTGELVATFNDVSNQPTVVFGDGATTLSAPGQVGGSAQLGGTDIPTNSPSSVTPNTIDGNDTSQTADGDGGGADGGFTIAADNAVQDEGDTGTAEDFTFTVSRGDTTGTAQVDVGVDFAASDADADDFDQASQTVTFSDGQETATANIRVAGDGEVEPDENFTAELTNPIGNNLADNNTTATGTIENDDTPSLSIDDVTVTERNSGTTPLQFTVTLTDPDGVSRPALQDVTFNAATVDDTATAGDDFLSKSEQLTIPQGATSTTFTVDAITDVAPEGDESFNVELSNPSNATISDGTGVGTIEDDDALQVSVNDVSVRETDSSNVATFTVSLNQPVPSGSTATVDFATAEGSATASEDFTSNNGTLTFNAGDTSQDVSVQIEGDNLPEGNEEEFSLNLSNPRLDGSQDGIEIAGGQDDTPGEGIGTIREDDVPQFSFQNVNGIQLQEGDAGTTNQATFTVELDGNRNQTGNQPAADTVLLNFVAFVPEPNPNGFQSDLVNDNTIADNNSGDFKLKQGTLTFEPGSTQQTFSIDVIGDDNVESDEQLYVGLFNPRDEEEVIFRNPDNPNDGLADSNFANEIFENPRNLFVDGQVEGLKDFDENDISVNQVPNLPNDDGQVTLNNLSGDQILGATSFATILIDDGVIGSNNDDPLFLDNPGGGNQGTNEAGNGELPDNNDNNILGRDGNDVIRGEDGNDTIDGGPGIDFVLGNEGDDSINAGDGDDNVSRNIPAGNAAGGISGGNGDDTLRGGNGQNDFVYSGGDFEEIDNGDTIQDFEPGDDRISIDVGSMTTGMANNTATISNTVTNTANNPTMVAVTTTLTGLFGNATAAATMPGGSVGTTGGQVGLRLLSSLIAGNDNTLLGNNGDNMGSITTRMGISANPSGVTTLNNGNLFQFASLDAFKTAVSNIGTGLTGISNPSTIAVAFGFTSADSKLFALGIQSDGGGAFSTFASLGSPIGNNLTTATIAKLNGVSSNIGGDILLF